MPTTILIIQDGSKDERDLSVELEAALASYLASQSTNPPLASLTELIFSDLQGGLFKRAVAQFPPQVVSDAQALADTAAASVQVEKDAVVALAVKK